MKHMSKQNKSDKKLRAIEISVANTAQILQVSERTVLNFIKTKQIEAVKVGKSWFVDESSVKAYVSKTSVSEKPAIFSEKGTPLSEPAPAFSESAKKPKNHTGVGGLNCYKLAVEIFRNPILVLGAEATFFEHSLNARIAQLQIKVLEHLGSGYHTFGSVKVSEYAKARAAAGSLLALLSSGFAGVLAEKSTALEQKLLPCLIALQRSAEKTRAANSARI